MTTLVVYLFPFSLFVSFAGERLHDFYVEVLQTPDDKSPGLCHHQVSAVGRSATFRCESPLYGRYVRIRKDNLSGDTDVLTLCEVQVNGKKGTGVLQIGFTTSFKYNYFFHVVCLCEILITIQYSTDTCWFSYFYRFVSVALRTATFLLLSHTHTHSYMASDVW